MKLSKDQRNAIVSGILPKLLEVEEAETRVKKVKGILLIYDGTHKDANGNQIKPGEEYTIEETRTVKVNHARRLIKLINDARNYEEMVQNAAVYLRTYANPAIFSTDKN